MDELGEKSLGNELWTKEIAAQNQQAEVILRTNTLKVAKPQLKAFLAKEDIATEFIEGYPDALMESSSNLPLILLSRVPSNCFQSGSRIPRSTHQTPNNLNKWGFV